MGNISSELVKEKLETGKQEKDKGNEQFKIGEITNDFGTRSGVPFAYSFNIVPNSLLWVTQAVLYLSGLDNTSMQSALAMGGASENPDDVGDVLKKEIGETLKSCYSNMAACYIKQSKYQKAITTCDKVIGLDPKNAKAYFRRGQSNFKLNNLDLAQKDLKQAVALAPQDKGIRDELAAVNARLQEYTQKSVNEFKGILA
ncbi:hypothetical protein DFS34DRAFT_596269 [Phlyctochytrium arcticum]|nr:hypothetical protein DFS34DRAFT_596269 [Phlyctochytrium arcticum]